MNATTTCGLSLTFTKAGSYSYPYIFRAKDGATIRSWHNRPFQGSICQARAVFEYVASKGCSIENLQTLETATAAQIRFIKRLNGLFEPAGGGFCQLAERESRAAGKAVQS